MKTLPITNHRERSGGSGGTGGFAGRAVMASFRSGARDDSPSSSSMDLSKEKT
ncbi:hypothetical protein AALP_AA8G379600 [Arabis alpina]|uniref:Uncharacterized protein n=1 Tax=Arabis alpina TaxID=50452 RepID=A0A087GC11_ARAAL|nr:hypothetical protein AALP_AA8G379600 [Arabis alpina]